jgi:RNA polymerase sigma-70 factor (ECF subfamily)
VAVTLMMQKLSDTLPDEKLLLLLQQGRKDAFESLFRKYYHPLWRYSVKFVRDSNEAEEIVQEFFIYLWEKKATLTLPDSVPVYLHVAIKNRCLNHLKKKIHAHSPIEEQADARHYEPNHMETEELTQGIEEAINRLPEKCRIIFLLSRQSQFSYKEIAEQLSISVKTVESQMGIALKKLKEHLLRHGINLIVLIHPLIENIF